MWPTRTHHAQLPSTKIDDFEPYKEACRTYGKHCAWRWWRSWHGDVPRPVWSRALGLCDAGPWCQCIPHGLWTLQPLRQHAGRTWLPKGAPQVPQVRPQVLLWRWCLQPMPMDCDAACGCLRALWLHTGLHPPWWDTYAHGQANHGGHWAHLGLQATSSSPWWRALAKPHCWFAWRVPHAPAGLRQARCGGISSLWAGGAQRWWSHWRPCGVHRLQHGGEGFPGWAHGPCGDLRWWRWIEAAPSSPDHLRDQAQPHREGATGLCHLRASWTSWTQTESFVGSLLWWSSPFQGGTIHGHEGGGILLRHWLGLQYSSSSRSLSTTTSSWDAWRAVPLSRMQTMEPDAKHHGTNWRPTGGASRPTTRTPWHPPAVRCDGLQGTGWWCTTCSLGATLKGTQLENCGSSRPTWFPCGLWPMHVWLLLPGLWWQLAACEKGNRS